jgi:ubiquitin-activating enzyme E1
MEIIKFVQNKPLSEMKNLFSNLALPLWVFSEPNPPAKAKKKAFD